MNYLRIACVRTRSHRIQFIPIIAFRLIRRYNCPNRAISLTYWTNTGWQNNIELRFSQIMAVCVHIDTNGTLLPLFYRCYTIITYR